MVRDIIKTEDQVEKATGLKRTDWSGFDLAVSVFVPPVGIILGAIILAKGKALLRAEKLLLLSFAFLLLWVTMIITIDNLMHPERKGKGIRGSVQIEQKFFVT